MTPAIRSRHRASAAFALVCAAAMPMLAQDRTTDLEATSREFLTPVAGKYEARIGGSRESANDKLRLDIGASVELLWHRLYPPPDDPENPLEGYNPYPTFLLFGTDFFTWTRLRAAGGFKFPVEAVDYYFGVNAEYVQIGGGPEARLRVAHISAHLVDGDPSFADTATQYITYSREFADLMVGLDLQYQGFQSNKVIRPYVGALWLFHTIPDTLGRVTPYAGIDVRLQPFDAPIVMTLGYEARLNTELEPIGEHLLRLGVGVGKLLPTSKSVKIEGSYYSGRSAYGQHFWKRESFWSLGFAVDF